jgi:SAM-dependent methyltransferase
MPFLRSGSFDGIFSHFALEYISPIGVQQVLREAARLLAPGGRMILHLTAPGLALGDVARTSPYDESALTKLLIRAGFEDFEVEQPEEKQIAIVHARGPGRDPGGAEGGAEGPAAVEHEAHGEIQVAAGFRSASAAGNEGPIVDASVCERVVAVGPDEFELQTWRWRGSRIAAAEATAFQVDPGVLRIPVAGPIEHHDVWRPESPRLEPPGDAYTTIERVSPSHPPGEEWRARGRQVIVERTGDDRDLLRSAAQSKDHFLVHRPDPAAPEIEALERDWEQERLHGIVLSAEAALRPESQPLLRWAGSRGVLIYIEPDAWGGIEAVAREVATSEAPILVVDPQLSGQAGAQAEVEVPTEAIAAALDAAPGLHVVLAGNPSAVTAELSERYPTRVLIGESTAAAGWPEAALKESTETLRYLTERATLMRLRSA